MYLDFRCMMALVYFQSVLGHLAVTGIYRRPGACNGVNRVRLRVCDDLD